MSKESYRTPSEKWKEIEGKAHLYKTAFCDGKCVRILGIVCPGTFSIHHPIFGEMHIGAYQLTEFCL